MTYDGGLRAAGWHDDLEDPTQLRYWDGSAWTERRSPKAGEAQPYATSVVGQPDAQRTAIAQPHAASAPAYGNAAPKSGAPWWLAATIAAITLLIGIGIGFGIGALVSGGDATVAAPKTTAAKPPATGQAAGDAPMSAEASPAADGDAGPGTAGNPRAIDIPSTYNTSWFGDEGTEWEGTLEGLVTIPVYESEDDQDARCYAILGTMSPMSIADGAITTHLFDTPDFEVIVDGEAVGNYGLCDSESLSAAGHGSMWDAAVSVGTEYRFFYEIFVPSTVTGDAKLIVVGSASDSGAVFYQPTSASVG